MHFKNLVLQKTLPFPLLTIDFCHFSFPFLSFSFASRLTQIKENHKFQKNGKEGHRAEDPAMGLSHVVAEIKEKHYLKYDFLV